MTYTIVSGNGRIFVADESGEIRLKGYTIDPREGVMATITPEDALSLAAALMEMVASQQAMPQAKAGQ